MNTIDMSGKVAREVFIFSSSIMILTKSRATHKKIIHDESFSHKKSIISCGTRPPRALCTWERNNA